MKASRFHLSLLSLGLASLLIVPTLRADGDGDKTPPPPPPPEGRHGGPGGPGGPMRMFEGLNLTDAQKEQIKQIMKDTEEERRQKIDAVLTDEQKAKLKEMKEAHEARRAKDGDKPADGTNPFPAKSN